MKKRIIIVAILSFLVFQSWGQTRQDVRNHMDSGKYQEAVKILKALEIVYPGEYGYTLKYAERCFEFQSNADRSFQNGDYETALKQYKRILPYSPNDKRTMEMIGLCEHKIGELENIKKEQKEHTEFLQCNSAEDYEVFIQKYPNGKYVSSAKRLLEIKRNETLRLQDDAKWKQAQRLGTEQAYSEYIRWAMGIPKAKYLNEARYCAYVTKARRFFEDSRYPSAKTAFDCAQEYYVLNTLDSARYETCCMEVMFDSIVTYRNESQLLDFLRKYPDSRHINIVYSYLYEYNMNIGKTKEAKSFLTKIHDKEERKSIVKSYKEKRKQIKKILRSREKQN